MLGWLLVIVRVLLGASLLAYVSYAALSVWAARKWHADRAPAPPDWTPAVTVFKPVRGVDAEAWENFRSFCLQTYPVGQIQILFGAHDPEDPALDLARRLQSEFPNHDIGIVVGSPDSVRGNNRKVCNLLSMQPHAKHDLYVLCDSDMRVNPDYLRRIVAPFAPTAVVKHGTESNTQTPEALPKSQMPDAKCRIQNRAVGLVTCPYRGARILSFAAAIEALSIGADFVPSTLVSRAMEGISFALGSTIVIPRAVLAEIGGFEPLLDELADDFRLGNGVFKAGYEVVMSDYVIDDILGSERFSAMWSRRLRWSRTLRVCRPAGYAGLFVTNGFALALAFLVAMAFSPIAWAAFGAVVGIRILTAVIITLRYTGDRSVLRFLPLLPISDLIGIALFVSSYFGSHIYWRGERFRLLPGGRLVRAD
jgi:ceramide glucosyltransferase